ncbi:MAG TPA: hypothetical protein V6C91_02365 [Coleofasciculaceae cyanobacterium]
MIALGKHLVRRFILAVLAVMAVVVSLGWHTSSTSAEPSPQMQTDEGGKPQLIAEAPFKKPELFIQRDSGAELTVLRMPTDFIVEVRCYGDYRVRLTRNRVGQNLLECSVPR